MNAGLDIRGHDLRRLIVSMASIKKCKSLDINEDEGKERMINY